MRTIYLYLTRFCCFYFLATRLFLILPCIWFWPNLIKVTSTMTTIYTQMMVGSEVTIVLLGQKGTNTIYMKSLKTTPKWKLIMSSWRNYSKLQNKSTVTLPYDPIKRGQRYLEPQTVIFTKTESSPSVIHSIDAWLTYDICIRLALSKVISFKTSSGVIWCQKVICKCYNLFRLYRMTIQLIQMHYSPESLYLSNVNLGSFGVTGIKSQFLLKVL